MSEVVSVCVMALTVRPLASTLLTPLTDLASFTARFFSFLVATVPDNVTTF